MKTTTSKKSGANAYPKGSSRTIPKGKKVSEQKVQAVKVKPVLPKGGVKFFEKLG